MNRYRGFSLIELVVVIILIGILAGLGVPRLFQSMDAAHDAAVQKFAAEFGSSLKSFRSDYVITGDGKTKYNGFAMHGENRLPVARSTADCMRIVEQIGGLSGDCLLYTSDAADEE